MGDAAIAPVAAVPEVGPGAAGTWDAAPTRILTGADVFYNLGNPGAGPRAAYLFAIVIFGIGALLLRQVTEPHERAA
jgi:hypothetical protein